MRAGLIRNFDERSTPWFEIEIYREALERARVPCFDKSNLRDKLIKNLIRLLAEDLISATEERIKKYVLERDAVDPVKQPLSSKIVDFSANVAEQVHNLQKLLKETVYTSYDVSRADIKARLYIQRVFKAYLEQPARMPDYVYRKYTDVLKYSNMLGNPKDEELNRSNLEKFKDKIKGDPLFVRTIAEHIAGMTDQYLLNEYRQLFAPEVW